MPQRAEFWSSKYSVVFEPNVMATLQSLYQQSCENRCEILATLTGHYQDNRTAVVTDIVLPTRGEFGVVDRDHLGITKLMKELWDRTAGQQFFLGEWHSHHFAPNTASQLDIKTARATATDLASMCPEFIMAISGSDGLRVYVITATSGRILIEKKDPTSDG